MSGTIYGVGLGPGDPDLISLKAARLVTQADVVAFFRKPDRPGHARTIVEGMLKPGATEMALEYPVTTEIAADDPAYGEALRPFYQASADRLAALAAEGRDVVVLCEGDPFLYGSFMHLHSRLKDRAKVEVVPGISGMAGCWTAADQPMTYGDDVLVVVPATLDEGSMIAQIETADALVVMKIGRNLAKVRRALSIAGFLDRAIYVERGTMADQVVMPLTDKDDDEAPYFAMVLVPGEGRRP
ncbi:precorrin-2 C(20)-methyltransferase [Blastochloris viridis]|uniref:Cobalt-precorrin-2 C20-methyltransferase n=1 Tax=Blastochloris viridis TaxID=1079 RepID=A0A0H5BQ89_BLAVI|nr:precorrin-2 C(20)-methyltransferase [Blastochloris viridis]ALK09583.1 Precorrin-2 C(20)-methyltransferase [Blastochloris viridis]BAS00529.1 cobalt-precorrin-2 C20-methyltransferase [Blastochloris viridis]CUU42246.1 Precorrin-2 C(20)-methyltransferase [Blastochloris viridis]